MKCTVNVKQNRFAEIAAKLPISAEVIVNGRHGPRMQEAARRRARVDTGAMRDGITWQATGQAQGALTASVDYTVHHEYGTRFIAAQPMLRPAFEEIEPDILRDFQALETML